jgi:hypothetical protein
MPRASPLKRKLRATEFYCVSCRKAVNCHADDIGVKVYRNPKTGSSPALRAVCPKCDTNLTKFIPRDSLAKMKAKYGSA